MQIQRFTATDEDVQGFCDDEYEADYDARLGYFCSTPRKGLIGYCGPSSSSSVMDLRQKSSF
jgi:hypothetical protein